MLAFLETLPCDQIGRFPCIAASLIITFENVFSFASEYLGLAKWQSPREQETEGTTFRLH